MNEFVKKEEVKPTQYNQWFSKVIRMIKFPVNSEGMAYDLFANGCTPAEAAEELTVCARFDPEKVKAGAKVINRRGEKVRILCYDLKNYAQPIVAAHYDSKSAIEIVTENNINGGYYLNEADSESERDLFMAI